jgi:Selenoprotein, putative
VSAAGVFHWVARGWSFLRDLTGDAAYDAYEARARARQERPRSREDFYLDGLRRKYSRPNRCC